MTRHYPIVIEHEANGDVSAYVAGLPIYAQAPTEAKAVADITSMLGAYFQDHARNRETPAARKLVARIDTTLRKVRNRMAYAPTTRVGIVIAAALVGRVSSA